MTTQILRVSSYLLWLATPPPKPESRPAAITIYPCKEHSPHVTGKRSA